MFECSKLYYDILVCNADVIVLQGGTSSGKTYSTIQTAFSHCISNNNEIYTVVGQDIPNLKVGALRDALNIYEGSDELKNVVKSYNKSERVFEFNSGSTLEFKSYDDPQDAKSGKRHRLFINEANGITFQMYSELALRTSKQVILDFNPNAEFWVHDKLIGTAGVELFITDHRHNPFLPDKIRSKIEALKEIDIELWRVYARGKTGKIEGLIFRNYERMLTFPLEGSKLISYGLDFGFTNDPTAFIEVRESGGELWIKQHIYEQGLTNQDISERLKILNIEQSAAIVADSAEPKSIEELRRLGWNIEPAQKGSDSIIASIDILKRYKLNLVGYCGEFIKELSSYKWQVDRSTNKTINKPVDFNNHLIDALRYVALNKLNNNYSGDYFIL